MKYIQRSLLVITAFSLLAGCLEYGSSGRPVDPAAVRQDTAEYLDRLQETGAAGVLLVARDDTPLIRAGFGMADRSAGHRWSADTVSDIGSLTKQFTGAVILALQEEGLLDVRDPITEYLSPVPADKRAITLHQLLTHSSGLVDPPVGDWDAISRDEYVQDAFSRPLRFEPGTSYAYSNAGYSLLGAVIETVSGVAYEICLRDRLLLPAGLDDTGYQLADWSGDRMAVGYRGDERWGTTLERPMAEDGPYWALRANGGIHSTANDLWQWAKALLAGEPLSQASLAEYWASHVDEGYGDSFYGYGWVSVDEGPGGHRLVMHNGGNGVFFADMAIYPEQQVVMVLLTNTAADWAGADRLLERVGLRMFEGRAYPG